MKDFFLFVDEFHRFSSGRIIESVINETVKAGLHLCVANQETGQLSDELLKAVLSMPNIIIFRVNFLDAKKLLPIFYGKVSLEDIIGLGVGDCIALISGEIVDFKGTRPRGDFSKELADKVVAQSRERYCTPLSVVEKKTNVNHSGGSRVIDSF